MTLHRLLPLIALILYLCLVAISLLRNPASRLNRIFAYFVSALALWNLGVFMLRSAPDPTSAYRWEVIIHVGVIALPAFYYHFVLIFLDSTVRRRRWLIVAYGLSALFSLLNLAGSAAFITGVQSTAWGWAPASDRKSTRLNSSHLVISYAVFCLKKKKKIKFRRLHRYIKTDCGYVSV